MQFKVLVAALMASTVTAVPAYYVRDAPNAVVAVRAPTPTGYTPTPTGYTPTPTGGPTPPPGPTGTGYFNKPAPQARDWVKPALKAPSAPAPAPRNVPVWPQANPLDARVKAPWFAMF